MLSATMDWTTVEDWLGADWPGTLFLRRDTDGDGNFLYEARAVIDFSTGMMRHSYLVASAVGLGETSLDSLRRCWEESVATMQRLARERLLSERGRAWLEERQAANEFQSREFEAARA